VGYDRDLAADERIDQRRFADIGRADERDESAPGLRRLIWLLICQDFLPFLHRPNTKDA
jgi:hypothetical protein